MVGPVRVVSGAYRKDVAVRFEFDKRYPDLVVPETPFEACLEQVRSRKECLDPFGHVVVPEFTGTQDLPCPEERVDERVCRIHIHVRDRDGRPHDPSLGTPPEEGGAAPAEHLTTSGHLEPQPPNVSIGWPTPIASMYRAPTVAGE